ncbi:MAG: hypothetical protein J6Z45_02455 [Oscillospiraceae bacterium]|nr:hypothetical protein [Oscillospiraceae bacterium]
MIKLADPGKKEIAACLLREKQESLRRQGLTRLPRRGDFTAEEVGLIKAYLGPWPRALEAAGLKPAREDGAKRQEQRISAKRKRTAAKAAEKRSQSRGEAGERK